MLVFLFATAPIGAHMIGRAAFMNRVDIWEGTICNDLEGAYEQENAFVSPEISGTWPVEQNPSSQA